MIDVLLLDQKIQILLIKNLLDKFSNYLILFFYSPHPIKNILNKFQKKKLI
jgi:hypothetical protein